MGHRNEPHFNRADTNKVGFLALTEFTARAAAKLESLEAGSTKTKARKK